MSELISCPILQDVQIENSILITIGFWLVALSVSIFLLFRFLRRLVKGAKDIDLVSVLDKILAEEAKNAELLTKLSREIEKIKDTDKLHLQKVGLVRFNPFSEIGGEHSFSLALLDGKDTGFVITGLHTRERTRVYIKGIKNGKCNLELSSEEKKAVSKAQKS